MPVEAVRDDGMTSVHASGESVSLSVQSMSPPRLAHFCGGVDPPVGVGPRLHRSDVVTKE